jgi:Zn-finger nucleic acid-binding protein
MAWLCPKCKAATLEPLSAAPLQHKSESSAVPASRCSNCRGVWMPHGALSHDLGLPTEEAAPGSVNLDAKVGFCPAGHGLLIRARVDAEQPFHLDRCGTCAGIWFDAGEWAALASTEWLHHLDDLWDPAWRKRMREERARKEHQQALEQALGPETARLVIELAAVLKQHPRQQSLAVAFLLDELKEG